MVDPYNNIKKNSDLEDCGILRVSLTVLNMVGNTKDDFFHELAHTVFFSYTVCTHAQAFLKNWLYICLCLSYILSTAGVPKSLSRVLRKTTFCICEN